MDDPKDPSDDPNVTAFPDAKQRRERLLLRAANDAGGKGEPVLNLPPAIKAVVVAILAVFIIQKILPFILGAEGAAEWVYAFAFVPARYTGGAEIAAGIPVGVAAVLSPVTHMFLHGGWLHLGINILSLMAFGAGIEKWMGPKKFVLLFFMCGLIGAVAQFVLAPHLENPMIGASGAISGLFGALLVEMHDRGNLQGKGGVVRQLLPFVILWIATSLLFGLFGAPGTDAPIAWATHVGGFIGGALLARPVKKLNI